LNCRRRCGILRGATREEADETNLSGADRNYPGGSGIITGSRRAADGDAVARL
jgi:hypothetical protein